MPKTDARFDPSGYALVADRIARFYQQFPTGRIVTKLHSRGERGGVGEVTFRALVYRAADDRRPAATGWASEREGDGEINTVACLENAETSAVGRALANLGFSASVRRVGGEDGASTAAAARERGSLALHRAATAAAVPRPLGVRETLPARGADRRSERPQGAKPRGPDEALQRRADVVRDLLALVERAEAAGLRTARAEALRRRLLHDTPPARQLERLECVLRGWLRRHGS